MIGLNNYFLEAGDCRKPWQMLLHWCRKSAHSGVMDPGTRLRGGVASISSPFSFLYNAEGLQSSLCQIPSTIITLIESNLPLAHTIPSYS